ncbi:MAG: hypothetical protein EZS28_038406, partial [Streblomastix strix]
ETYAKIEVYNKTEVDGFLDDKADFGNSYKKTQGDELLNTKADKTEIIDAYNKTETDELLNTKADKTEIIDAYNKTETDQKFDLKAEKTDLDNFVDLQSQYTISGQKQFSIITVASVAKQDKTDESILLAGGGDILVCTLVNQAELQEVRDIAQGKSKGYEFATTDEMNTWMEDQKMSQNQLLAIIYIQLINMSNVATTIGAATGNGNAITDISIYGNTITPANNELFVMTSYDQNIGRQKIFTTTIQSVGIAVQNYDNISVVCAGSRVKSISEIVSTVDLTDYYNKAKTDELLGDKANVGDIDNYYDKHDVDERINDPNQLTNDDNELIRAFEDQTPTRATISNLVWKTGEELYQTNQG